MRAHLLSFVLLAICIQGVCGADPSVSVAENPVKQYSFAKVEVAVEKGDQVAFQVFPNPVKREVVGNLLFLSGPPGAKYTVLVTVVNFGEEKGSKKRFDTGQVEVTFAGEDDNTPPDPPPGPDTEAATVTSKLKAAFKMEKEDEKVLAPKLKDLYAKYSNESELEKYTTYGALESAMRKDAADYKVSGKLQNTQVAIAEYLTTKIPGRESGWENVIIESKDRKKIKTAFATVSNALGKLK